MGFLPKAGLFTETNDTNDGIKSECNCNPPYLMKLRSLSDFFDHLTPPRVRGDDVLRAQAHALIGYCFIGWLIGPPMTLSFALLGDPPLAVAIAVAMACGHSAVLLMRRLDGRMEPSQWLASGSFFLMVAFGLVRLGGDTTTINVGWSAVVPVMAIYFGNFRMGVVWLLASIYLVLGLSGASALGHPFAPHHITNVPLAYTTSAVCLILFTGGLALAIQHSRARLQRDLFELARRDALTGLANRRCFQERLEDAVGSGLRGHPAAVLLLDLDRFKMINDTLGHAAGDAVLVEFSQRLRQSVRQADLVARLGGDEFAIILQDLEHASRPGQVADRILRAMQVPVQLPGASLQVATSVGVALCQAGETSADRLLARADEDLYRAKQAGRNQRILVA